VTGLVEWLGAGARGRLAPGGNEGLLSSGKGGGDFSEATALDCCDGFAGC
jgi:hypothetical protein